MCNLDERKKGTPLTSVKKAVVKKVGGRKAAKARKPSLPGKPEGRGSGIPEADLPFGESIGYQIRTTHRAMQRFLQSKIEPHGITLGMWYFLRALWHEDGLTQRELSNRAGTMEPTTLSAILIMEKKGLVRRVRNRDDRRKWHIHLTPKGRALKSKLLPLAREVVDTAVQNLARGEVAQLLKALAEVQNSVHATLAGLDDPNAGTAE
jgi:MarR family transcriptional regulator, organic hydroperoxide resistance regulator